MLRSVLVLVDRSPQSEWALTEAAALARREHARITLLTPVEPVPACVSLAAVSGQYYQRQYADLQASMLRRLAAALPQDLSVTTVMAEGRPGRLLRDELRRGRHDLVVIGDPPARRLWRLLPSRERRIARRLPTATLLVRKPALTPARRRGRRLPQPVEAAALYCSEPVVRSRGTA
jgi:nucleotide-binding universal stress UspA family protein